MRKQRIVAIVPQVQNEAGHCYSYHVQANKAAELLGCKYVAITPVFTEASNWPAHWEKRLIFPKLKHVIRKFRGRCERHLLRCSITSAIFAHVQPEEHLTLFLEDPNSRFFRLFIRSLLLTPKADLSIWIHMHHAPIADTFEKLQWRFRLWRIARVLKKGRLKITTTTEQLQKLWEEYLQRPVAVIPNPLGPIEKVTPFDHKDNKILCWYPGPPNPWKGEECIQSLLDSKHPLAKKLKIALSDKYQLVTGRGLADVQRLPAILDRDTYLRWLNSSDIILLPYSAHTRNVQMSGIFVEAILANAIPVVREGTWIASELLKYGLNDLIVDWNNDDLPAVLAHLYQDKALHARLEPMRTHYRKYHSVEGYADFLKELIENNSNQAMHV